MNMKRMRGRSHRHGGGPGGGGGGGGSGGGGSSNYRQGGHAPMNRNHVFESNAPDMRLRGTAQQLFEKYLQLGRDATGGGDRVMAESYFQHAEHYFRILNAMSQAQQPGQQGGGQQGHPGPQHGGQGVPLRRYQNGPNGPEVGEGSYNHEQPEMNGHSGPNGYAEDRDGADEPADRDRN